MSASKIKRGKRLRVYLRDDYRCLYCGRQVRIGEEADYQRGSAVEVDIATVDHIIPGDDNSVDNLATSCGPCNADKADFLPLRHPLTRELVEGVTWMNVWMRAYRRELFEHTIPLTTPRDLVNRILRK